MYAVAYGPLHWHRIFELEASPMAAQPSFFREDFYIVYADTQEEAYAR